MNARGCLLAILLLTIAASGQINPGPFDGSWDTVLTCPNASGAYGFSYRFLSVVKDSALHGEKGTKGEPGWLEVNGKLPPDGVARLYANGLVGAAPYAVGQRPAGTEYGFHIDAKFSAEEGTGRRVEGRPCDITFTRTKAGTKGVPGQPQE